MQCKFCANNLKVFSQPLNIPIEIQQNDEIGCSVGLENEDDFFKWSIVFEGPGDTLYEVSVERACVQDYSQFPLCK